MQCWCLKLSTAVGATGLTATKDTYFRSRGRLLRSALLFERASHAADGSSGDDEAHSTNRRDARNLPRAFLFLDFQLSTASTLFLEKNAESKLRREQPIHCCACASTVSCKGALTEGDSGAGATHGAGMEPPAKQSRLEGVIQSSEPPKSAAGADEPRLTKHSVAEDDSRTQEDESTHSESESNGNQNSLPRGVSAIGTPGPGKPLRYGVRLRFSRIQVRVGSRFCTAEGAHKVAQAFRDTVSFTPSTGEATVDDAKMTKYSKVFIEVYTKYKNTRDRVSLAQVIEQWHKTWILRNLQKRKRKMDAIKQQSPPVGGVALGFVPGFPVPNTAANMQVSATFFWVEWCAPGGVSCIVCWLAGGLSLCFCSIVCLGLLLFRRILPAFSMGKNIRG